MKTNVGKGLLFLLAALLLLAPGVARLAEPVEEFEYYLDDAGHAIITKYKGVRSHVQIPTMLDAYVVVGIGPKAFSGNTILTNLEIHDNVAEIELGAFQGCVNLGDVRFGDGLSSIGSSAFENTALYRVQLPASLADLYNRAFANCVNLKEVNLPRGLWPMGSEVFAGCPNLTLKVYKGSPGHTYAMNNNLRHIVLAESMDPLPDSIVHVGSTLPLKATVQPPEASQEVTWHSSDDNIATVDDKGVVTGVKPGTATITATAKDGSGVKAACSITVAYPFSYEHIVSGIRITGYTGNAAEVKVPGEIEGRPVTRIGSNAFSEKTGITKVVLPGSIQSIERNAFSGCSSLAGINLPEGLHTLDGGAFWGCGQLSGITLPQSLTSIGWGVFYHCSSLTSLKIPDGVTAIGTNAFYGCSNLTTVTLPKGVTSIENYLFSGCSRLTGISIPAGVKSIGDDAFYECTSLADIRLPAGVTSIGKYAFYLCKNLNRITIRSHVTSIGKSAFGGSPVTIYGDVPSAAKDYADKNNIPFVDLAGGIPGDANDDLEVNAKDLISLVEYIINKKPCPSMKNADANKDGKVNELDAVAIINMTVGD